jgi:hypothetical protein
VTAAALAAIREKGVWERPPVTVTAGTEHDDNIFVECAEEAHASYLVTGQSQASSASLEEHGHRHTRRMLDILDGHESKPA